MMRICTYGLWHLGATLSAHLAKIGCHVIGVDPAADVVAHLKEGKAPVHEPGLDELVRQESASGRLRFTTSLEEAARQAKIFWVTFDTPVSDDDVADVTPVKKAMLALLKIVPDRAAIIVSSQVPAGFCAGMEKILREKRPRAGVKICYSPENLRLGQSLKLLANPDRVVAGIRAEEDRSAFEPVLKLLSPNIIWMKTESAEMTKHAINSFLGLSVVFANELAALCERIGADAHDVAKGLRSDERIGPKAYVKSGSAYAGGTLGRDIRFLNELSKHFGRPTPVLSAVPKSNARHRLWVENQLGEQFKSLKGKRVAVLGLAYKAGTDTLRRSWTIELAAWLLKRGAKPVGYDPLVTVLPDPLAQRVSLAATMADAVRKADAVVIGNDAAELVEENAWREHTARLRIVDPNRYLEPVWRKLNMKGSYRAVGLALEN